VLYLTVLSAGLARAASQRERARGEDAARREARLEAQLAEARLSALRRQLDPHFLFNTLNAVSALVERDPRGVRRMLARLSDLLRFATDGAERAEHALRDELALVDRYLEIMQVRLQGRLTVVRAIDATVTDAAVPTLVLQPLVENAIRHGVERRAGPTRITLAARREGAMVVLAVRDDGPGPAGAVDAASADATASDATTDVTAPDTGATGAIGVDAAGSDAPRAGVGLANTRARLAALHGARASLALRREGGETIVELRLPYRSLS
jgi:LytS/YehU family sensor histidine kinase